MKCTFVLALTAVLLSPLTGALTLRKGADPRVLSLPIERQAIAEPLQRDRSRMRERGTLQATLDNEKTLYLANITLGTPPQSFRIHIDTGSSDLWVNAVNSNYCSDNASSCKASGTYAANSSSTYKYLGSQFNISYIDGSGAAGDYVTDTMSMSGATLKNLQFGVGYNTTADGILGIGYQVNEVQVGRLKQAAYANVPVALVQQGIIPSAAYSLWLNDLSASTGAILFGGVDTARFSGVLATLPVQKFNGVNSAFLITLTGLSLAGTSIATNQAQAVLLDSGSSLTYLPNAMTSAIYDSVGAQYDSTQGAAFVPCTLRSNTSTLDFTFTAPTIKVPMDELVLDIASTTGHPVTFANGVPACLFGIAPAGTGTPVLGDTFLRSAYVVYDLQNNQISIAQTRFNATASSVLEIGTGTSPVPGATVVASPVAATAGVGTTMAAAAAATTGAKSVAVRGRGVSSAAMVVGGAVAVVVGAW